MRPWDIVTTEDPGTEAGGEECIDALRFNHAPSGTPTKSPAPNAIRSIKPTMRRLFVPEEDERESGRVFIVDWMWL